MGIKLKTRLDNPDRIRDRSCSNSSNSGSGKMNPRVLLAVIEATRDDLLSVAVGEEVDRACGDDADKGWTKTLEKGPGRLFAIYIANKMYEYNRVVKTLS